jgi:hypothetical protein
MILLYFVPVVVVVVVVDDDDDAVVVVVVDAVVYPRIVRDGVFLDRNELSHCVATGSTGARRFLQENFQIPLAAKKIRIA